MGFLLRTIGFYLHNSAIKDVDCTEILKGNPGIGGSEYEIITIAQLLTSESFKIILYADAVDKLPSIIDTRKVFSLENAIEMATADGCELLIFKHEECWLKQNVLDNPDITIKIVIWAHNFIFWRELSYYAKNKHVARVICVGKEQLDLYRDHQLFQKSDYIFNTIYFPPLEELLSLGVDNIIDRKKNVVYIGSLIPTKRFHLLASIWPKVLEKEPSAQLYVIGGGNLYDRNIRLGKFQIAEEAYEETFIHYLLGDNGHLLPSVHFLGVLGSEKNDVLRKMKVGVPNPTGNHETFGITAIEMQLMGCMVTTRRCPGYLDTIGKGGVLYDDIDELAECIVKLLKKNDHDYVDIYEELFRKFSYENVLPDWVEFLSSSLVENRPLHPITPIVNNGYNLKWLKECNRKIKRTIPGGYLIFPTIGFVQAAINKVGRRFFGKQSKT